MTLINFLTRIHFADGVLEEALRSEMERLNKRRPLVIASQKHIESPIGESIYSSFAIRTKVETFSDIPSVVAESTADSIAEAYGRGNHDLIIAFGGNTAIDLAKIARLAIAMCEPVCRLASEEGGTQGINSKQPELIAIPDISGFSSAVCDYSQLKLAHGKHAMLQTRKMVPDVVICDPTVTLGSSKSVGASAAAAGISRGIGAYFARGFNPPADGLALDSINRIVSNSDAALNKDELPARREMMAGSLNSALSMQKGLCGIHAVTAALASASDSEIDFGAVGRLLLPHLVRHYGDGANERSRALKRSLLIRDDEELSKGLKRLFCPLQLPNSLSKMGIARGKLKRAARLASSDRAIRNGPRQINQNELLSILEAVY